MAIDFGCQNISVFSLLLFPCLIDSLTVTERCLGFRLSGNGDSILQYRVVTWKIPDITVVWKRPYYGGSMWAL